MLGVGGPDEKSMKILHIVPGLQEAANGIAVAARLVAARQRRDGDEVALVDVRDVAAQTPAALAAFPVVWVHSMWLPATLRACHRVLCARRILVRMTHANLDPLRLRNRAGWKKALVAPFERALMRAADCVVVTCPAERAWCEAWGVPAGKIELFDLKAFFNLPEGRVPKPKASGRPLKVLFIGRAGDPLKGLRYLQRAVEELKVELRVETQAFGDAKEAAFAWCDVLCLPTLSENFGLVVAEALQRGRRVVVTDGATAWADDPRVVYVSGFREGDDMSRVQLLRDALQGMGA